MIPTLDEAQFLTGSIPSTSGFLLGSSLILIVFFVENLFIVLQ
jgi:hypothetical protein